MSRRFEPWQLAVLRIAGECGRLSSFQPEINYLRRNVRVGIPVGKVADNSRSSGNMAELAYPELTWRCVQVREVFASGLPDPVAVKESGQLRQVWVFGEVYPRMEGDGCLLVARLFPSC